MADKIQNGLNLLEDYYTNYCDGSECKTCKYDGYFSCRLAIVIDKLLEKGIDYENLFKSKQSNEQFIR